MLKKLLVSALAAFLLNTIVSAKGDEAPAWLRQAASASVPSYGKEVHAVVLHDESRKTVEEDGRIRTVDYGADSEKVKEMRAWLIRPSGEIKTYGKKETMDVALVENDVYNDARMKLIAAGDDADAGCVFGYEIVSEERSVFSQFKWYFQHDIPALLSRITVAMPQGWRAESVTFNHAKIEPVVNGATYTWEMRNLPFIEDEPARPELTNLAPRIAISIHPPENKSTMLRPFKDWKDVSRYLSELSDPQTASNDAMNAKAAELTANAKTEYEKIQAEKGCGLMRAFVA